MIFYVCGGHQTIVVIVVHIDLGFALIILYVLLFTHIEYTKAIYTITTFIQNVLVHTFFFLIIIIIYIYIHIY